MALGVEPGEHVALWMNNRPEWLFLTFAIARVGAVLVPLNTRYRTDDVAYTVRQSDSGTWISIDRSGPRRLRGHAGGRAAGPRGAGPARGGKHRGLPAPPPPGRGRRERRAGTLGWEAMLAAARR